MNIALKRILHLIRPGMEDYGMGYAFLIRFICKIRVLAMQKGATHKCLCILGTDPNA
jgi:hypothetical protein